MKALLKEMKRKRMLPEALAKEVGVSKTTIHNWLSGACSPTFKNMDKLQELGFSETAYLEPNKEV